MKYKGKIIYCPKCKSEDINIFDVQQTPNRVSMDDLQKPRTPPVPYLPVKKAMCSDCGYEVIFVENEHAST